MFKNQKLSRVQLVFFILLITFIYSNCCKQPAVVVVRESDFRLGPIPLPLDDNEKKDILKFLLKGGDHEQENIVYPRAKKKYKELLELLSQEDFLNSKNFEKKGEKGKITERLKQWFKNRIVYTIIDATKDHPPIRKPISMTDGTFWWVFYRSKEKDDEGYFAIIKLLITLRITKELEHFEKY